MKTDLRVRYTREVIQRAFLELLKEKPLNRITVKEVCDRAEINRGTFYKHYLDCYDLMDKLEAQALEQFEELLECSGLNGEGPILLSILYTLQGQREQLRGILQNNEGSRFVQRLTERFLRYMETHAPDAALPQGEQGAQKLLPRIFLAGGCGAVLEYWIRSGMKEPPEQVKEEIIALSGALYGRQGG